MRVGVLGVDDADGRLVDVADRELLQLAGGVAEGVVTVEGGVVAVGGLVDPPHPVLGLRVVGVLLRVLGAGAGVLRVLGAGVLRDEPLLRDELLLRELELLREPPERLPPRPNESGAAVAKTANAVTIHKNLRIFILRTANGNRGHLLFSK